MYPLFFLAVAPLVCVFFALWAVGLGLGLCFGLVVIDCGLVKSGNCFVLLLRGLLCFLGFVFGFILGC